ncbi:MAG: class I SAM-dependent methyltransferase [Lacunisphaera sp.]|nr:class I SAM-dependent methyltransferase [Lacunisphaera sp.]
MNVDDFNHAPHACALADLPQRLHWPGGAPSASARSLADWRMEDDDAPIFSYLYRQFQPRRHLEFGTWQGFGASLCLDACAATVWTINLPEGESKPDGSWAYSEKFAPDEPVPSVTQTQVFGSKETGPVVYHRTDAQGFIGRLYRARGLGHRVCQIYCDSRNWDTTAYPPGFFDSALVDGGHAPEVVISDTRKALQVLRPGGLILWHDFCPVPEIRTGFESVRGVTSGLETLLPELSPQMQTLLWIKPSWILLGLKQ